MWLLFGDDGRIDIHMMVDEVWIHPRSFIRTSCEHVNISLKKHYQLFLLLRRQLGSDLKEFFQIIINNNFL